MEYRQLGRSGLMVSTFSFGVMTFGGAGGFARIGETQGADAASQIDMCLEAGVNLFDTADMYSGGQSEEILGQTLASRRAQVLIATKGFGRTGEGVNAMGASRRHILEACEASLRRLKTDYIDLYQIHNLDSLTPAEETLRALDDLVRAGKVRYIGSSNFSGWTKMKSLAVSERLGLQRYVSQQIQYSLISRDAEDELLPLGVDQGVGALIWGPLANGYLSGKYRRGDEGGRIGGSDRLAALDDERAHRILEAMDAIVAARPGVSLSQVALNWIVRRAGVASILVGARTAAQLADNLAAATWSLSDAEMASLAAASDRPPRYPYFMHREYGGERNPRPADLPAVFPG